MWKAIKLIQKITKDSDISNTDIALDSDICLTGEVGLAGEIRPVSRLEQRIREAEKLGFKKIIVPGSQKIGQKFTGIEVIRAQKVADAFRFLIKK